MLRTVLLAVALIVAVLASSHSEAPGSQKNLKADLTDFYMFRSYDPTSAPNMVTFIMNIFPLQAPFGGPNYAAWSNQHFYEINIDNTGDGVQDIIFQFAYDSKLGQRPGNQQVTINSYSCPNPDVAIPQQVPGGIALAINGTSVPVPLKFVGPITPGSQAALNFFEWVTLKVVAGRSGQATATNAVIAGTSTTQFTKPFDYAGTKTFGSASQYHQYASQYVYNIQFPAPSAAAASGTCSGRLFAGPRRESFSVALGRIFDLINLDPINVQDCDARNDLANFNIGTFALEVPSNCVIATGQTVIAAWTTVREKTATGTPLRQVSRLGSPLVNEVVIGLTDKDLFNRADPVDDVTNFADYVLHPTLPTIIQLLFPIATQPNHTRTDILTAFLTGFANVNQLSATPFEALRLNTAIQPTPYLQQLNYGILTTGTTLATADLAGFPNGRRPGDDVVDIALRVMIGRLCHPPFDALPGTCSPANAPVGTVPVSDGSPQNARQFLPVFPYLPIPLPGAYADANYDSCTQVCGDSMQQTPEQCDDGNTNDGDGCSSLCLVELGADCSTPGSPCGGICGDGLLRGTEQCDTGLSRNSQCCVNCMIVAGCTCNTTNVPTTCVPPAGATITTTGSTTMSTTMTSSSSAMTPSRPPTSSSSSSSTGVTSGGVIVSGCFSTNAPNDNTDPTCIKVRQQRVEDGEYCGWCELEDTFEFVWRYCHDGSPCAPDAGGVPLCNPVKYVGIGEQCDALNRVICRDELYDVACVQGVCGCVNCIQPGGQCPIDGKNSQGEDVYSVNSGCQFGSCDPVSGVADGQGVCTSIADGQPCGTNPNECLPASYCATEQNGAFCRSRLAVGADCSSNPLGCTWNAQCFAGECVAYGSRGAGEECSSYLMCQQGLGCDLSANPPACFNPDAQGSACTFPDKTGDSCPDGYVCLCNYGSGSGECFTPVSGKATAAFIDALECIDAAQCTTELSIDKQGITFFKDNCIDDNCASQVKRFINAGSDGSFDNGLRNAKLGAASPLVVAVTLLVVLLVTLL